MGCLTCAPLECSLWGLGRANTSVCPGYTVQVSAVGLTESRALHV